MMYVMCDLITRPQFLCIYVFNCLSPAYLKLELFPNESNQVSSNVIKVFFSAKWNCCNGKFWGDTKREYKLLQTKQIGYPLILFIYFIYLHKTTLWILSPITYTESAYEEDLLITIMNMKNDSCRQKLFQCSCGQLTAVLRWGITERYWCILMSQSQNSWNSL